MSELGKKCGNCQEIKPRSFFNRDSSRGDGLSPKCKMCESVQKSEHGAMSNIIQQAEEVIEPTPEELSREIIRAQIRAVHKLVEHLDDPDYERQSSAANLLLELDINVINTQSEASTE